MSAIGQIDVKKVAADTIGKLVPTENRGGSEPPPSDIDDAISWRKPWRIGVIAILFSFGGLGGWAAFMPLESAAIAPAEVVVAGNVKDIQHLEGGIVAEILVDEGQRVDVGQLLIRLDDVKAQAELERVRNQYDTNLAIQARLIAEQKEAKEIVWPQQLINRRNDPAILAIMASQEQLFRTRDQALVGQIDLLQQRNLQFDDEINSLLAQQKAEDDQLALIAEEIKDVESLYGKGLERKSRLLALQRSQAQITGSRESRDARMAQVRNQKAETQLRILDLRNRQMNEVATELREIGTTLADLQQQFNAAQDVLDRTRILAPISGEVVGLNVHTVGGVIRPGDTLMQIVPSGAELIVDAQVSPNDIDVVHKGQKASIRFTSLNQRDTPAVDGTVESVSADRIEPEVPNQPPYYLARVALDPESLGKLQNVTLQPGMPAQALIITGERSVLQAIIGPMTDAISLAFRHD